MFDNSLNQDNYSKKIYNVDNEFYMNIIELDGIKTILLLRNILKIDYIAKECIYDNKQILMLK